MKLLTVVALAAVLLTGGCTARQVSPPPHQKTGAASTLATSITWLSALPAITGNNATIVLYDTTAGTANHQTNIWVQRVLFSGRCDQAITLLYQVEHSASSTWRTMNGNGSGDTMAANTDTVLDFLVLGPDSRLQVVTGGTGPSTCEYDVGLYGDRTLGMFQ